MISFLGSFALKFAFFAHFMHFRQKNRYNLRAVSWGKFIWKELICVKNLTFHNSVVTPHKICFETIKLGQENILSQALLRLCALVCFSVVNLQSVFRLEGVSTLVTLENILKISSFSFFFRNFLVRLLQQKKQVFSSNSSLLLAFRLTVDGVGFFFFFLVGAELRNVKFFTQINSFQMNLPQGKALKS